MTENKINPSAKITSRPLWIITFILFIVSILIDVCAWFWADYNEPIANSLFVVPYKNFIEVPAWFMFPIYFPIAALVIWQSWDAFIKVWEKLPETNVIKMRGQEKVSNEIVKQLIKEFKKYRYRLILVSFILGFVCMYVDSQRERNTMIHEQTFSGQLARACEDPDFLSKWLWNNWIVNHKYSDNKNPCSLEKLKEPSTGEGIKNPTKEQQYHWRKAEILKIINTNTINYSNDRIPPPKAQWVTVTLFHLEDGILISLGWLIFLQSLAHSYFFCRFEKLKTSQEFGLSIELNVNSDLNEFGLEHWNHTLNNLYWYLSAAFIAPILSRGAQPDLNNLDTSQVWLQILVPLLVAAPMITTIIVRQMRIPASWNRLSKTDYQKFLEQRLWPLDKNWSSKLGVVLAFFILSLFLGVNIAAIF
jgi:hypothetical protein